jgi:hypothetical protein
MKGKDNVYICLLLSLSYFCSIPRYSWIRMMKTAIGRKIVSRYHSCRLKEWQQHFSSEKGSVPWQFVYINIDIYDMMLVSVCIYYVYIKTIKYYVCIEKHILSIHIFKSLTFMYICIKKLYQKYPRKYLNH